MSRLAARFGLRAENLLDFSVNINPDGPPASVLLALRDALHDGAVITQYPDLEELQLRRTIGIHSAIGEEMVAVGNGFVPLLDAALRVLEVRRCLLPSPAFGEYSHALARAGVAARPYRLDPARGFRYEPTLLLDAITNEQCDAVLLANPQNPSGVVCEAGALAAFVEEACRRDVRVLLDEAFIDYAPATSLVGQAFSSTNLVIFRSVTKFYAMAGMRVAYAVATEPVANQIRRAMAPWAITTLAAIAVRAALDDQAYAERTIRLNAERRAMLADALRRIGLGVYEAAANFLLLQLPSEVNAEGLWARLIREEGIVLRHCGNFEGIGQGHLRCAVRGEVENATLIAALERQLQKTNCNAS